MSVLRVLIADNDMVVRRCLRTLLGEQPGIEIVGEANAGDDLLIAISAFKPDRVLVDIQMPGSGGLELVRRIKTAYPSVCVVVFSLYADQLTEALRAGAGHYLLKGCRVDELMRALRNPCCGRPWTPHLLPAQGIS